MVSAILSRDALNLATQQVADNVRMTINLYKEDV